MANCTIKCPKCGQEAFCVPENENEANLTYICDKCKNEYTVTFFDYCPNCNRNVGFLEGNSFRNDMISVGKDLVKTVFKPLSAIDSFGNYFVDVISDNVKDSNGDGFCPICHKRFLRCSKCNELVHIKSNAVYKDSFECMCGTALVPCGANNPNKHSKKFVGSALPEKQEKKMRNITRQSSLGIAPAENLRLTFLEKQEEWEKEYEAEQEEKQKHEDCMPKSPIILKQKYSKFDLLKMIDICQNGHQSVKFSESDKILPQNIDIIKNNLKILYGIELSTEQANWPWEFGDFVKMVWKYGVVKETNTSNAPNTNNNQPTANNISTANTSKEEHSVSTAEKEYIDEFKECMTDGEIGNSERRLLNKLRDKLGISEDRAIELEKLSTQPKLTEAEQEYLEEVKACLADGEIGPSERRLLNKFREKLNISETRGLEIEKMPQ